MVSKKYKTLSKYIFPSIPSLSFPCFSFFHSLLVPAMLCVWLPAIATLLPSAWLMSPAWGWVTHEPLPARKRIQGRRGQLWQEMHSCRALCLLDEDPTCGMICQGFFTTLRSDYVTDNSVDTCIYGFNATRIQKV